MDNMIGSCADELLMIFEYYYYYYSQQLPTTPYKVLSKNFYNSLYNSLQIPATPYNFLLFQEAKVKSF